MTPVWLLISLHFIFYLQFASYAETAYIAPCTPIRRSFSVRVNFPLGTNEHVGLVGDSKSLGEWQLERSVALERMNDAAEWTATVMLHSYIDLNYRYFIYAVDQSGHKQIRRWETHFKPRSLIATCNTDYQQFDVFGESKDGEIQINRGWIQNEFIYQFQFTRERMFQVNDINKFDPETVRIKLIALAADEKTPLNTSDTSVNIEVAKMAYGKSELRQQEALGEEHKRADITVFHITVPVALDPAFAIVFSSSDHKPMGQTIIRPSLLRGSEGELLLNITESVDIPKTVIARLKLPYLVVKPLRDADASDFRTSYAYRWPKSWPILDVGHRGNGKSYIASPPAERENTLSSFLKAYELFADMIELDVHLTADSVPVVYHDFGLHTAPQEKLVSDVSQLEYVLIKDVTYDSLRKMRIFAVINGEIKEYPAHDSEPIIENRIFPRLVDVFEGLPSTLGIDVEIKWPQKRKCGGVEAEQTIDKNFFVDQVLKVVLQKGCDRAVIFSSFDADICTMLRYKQNKVPVMFLSMGKTKKWEPFLDLRTRSFEEALNNAQAMELAGTAPHAEDFSGTQGAAMLQKARDLDQIVVVWGDNCNSKEAISYFHNIGASAVCYDRSDLYVPETKSVSFFNTTAMIDKFAKQCRPKDASS